MTTKILQVTKFIRLIVNLFLIILLEKIVLLPTYCQLICEQTNLCTICWNSLASVTDTSQPTISFVSCDYQYQGQKASYMQSQCLPACCNSQSTSMSTDEVYKCKQKEKKNTIIIVVCSIGGFVIISVSCFFCLWKSGSLRNCCSCFSFTNNNGRNTGIESMERINIHHNVESNNSKNNQNENTNQKQNFQQLQWIQEKTEKYENNKNQNSVRQSSLCSVCLDGKIDCLTQCKHTFHYKCLNEWVNKKQWCPFCRAKDIEYVRFYCRRCYKKYKKISLKQFKDIMDILQQVGICKQCINL